MWRSTHSAGSGLRSPDNQAVKAKTVYHIVVSPHAPIKPLAARRDDCRFGVRFPRVPVTQRSTTTEQGVRVPSTQTKAEGTQSTVLPRAQAVEWARKLYDGAVDRKDAAGFAAVFADDAWMRFGNADPIIGRQAIESAIAQFFTLVAGLKHDMTGIWSQQDAVICEATVTYTRHDRKTVEVPAVTIFRLRNSPNGPLAHRVQMFVDLAPLFGGS